MAVKVKKKKKKGSEFISWGPTNQHTYHRCKVHAGPLAEAVVAEVQLLERSVTLG